MKGCYKSVLKCSCIAPVERKRRGGSAGGYDHLLRPTMIYIVRPSRVLVGRPVAKRLEHLFAFTFYRSRT